MPHAPVRCQNGDGLMRRDKWEATGGDMTRNREALFRTVALYRRVAVEVTDQLRYRYPDALDRDVTEFARRMLDGA